MKDILITGGCGFQGSHLALRLNELGHNVTVLAAPSLHAKKNSFILVEKGINVVWGTVLDKDVVERCVDNKDVVFHLAAKINVDESIKVPDEYLRSNFIGTLNVIDVVKNVESQLILASTCEVYGTNLFGTFNVLESAKKYNNHVVFVGSSAAYGSIGSIHKMNEHHPTNPHSPYAVSKLCADRLCLAYHKTYGTNVKIVRPFNMYGPLQKKGGAGAAIPIFFDKAMSNNPIMINGSGNQTRDFLYIDDLIDAYMIIMNATDLNGKVVNVGSGKEYKIIDIASKIIKMVGKGEIQHRAERSGEVDSFIADTSFMQGYGFSPKVSIDEGLERYYESIAR